MSGTLKVDSINADSNLALKIANTAVAFIDATGLRPVAGNLNLDATATSKFYLPSANTVAIQTAGVTAVTVDSSQNVTLAGTLTTTGITNSGVATGARFNPTGSSVTGNGMYLPAANSLGLSTNGTNAVYIDSSQNVGIGTASPSYKLNVTATNTNGDTGAIFLTSPSTDGTQFRLNNTGSGGHSYTFYSTGSGNGPGAGALGLYDQTDGAYRMVITSGGFLCIGGATATTYNETLRIKTAGQQGIHINDSSSASSINYQYFTKGSGPTNVGAIYYNGSVMAYQTTSDYRLKENVAPIANALNKINLLKPVAYTWKDNQQSGEGFLAHELQEHFPDAVSGTKDEVDENGNPKYQGMDSSVIIATMVKAIQEQQVLITAQSATITALTARIVALENR
jgi:hypothetical protein